MISLSTIMSITKFNNLFGFCVKVSNGTCPVIDGEKVHFLVHLSLYSALPLLLPVLLVLHAVDLPVPSVEIKSEDPTTCVRPWEELIIIQSYCKNRSVA